MTALPGGHNGWLITSKPIAHLKKRLSVHAQMDTHGMTNVPATANVPVTTLMQNVSRAGSVDLDVSVQMTGPSHTREGVSPAPSAHHQIPRHQKVPYGLSVGRHAPDPVMSLTPSAT